MRIDKLLLVTGLFLLPGFSVFADSDNTAELDRLAEQYLEAVIPLYGYENDNPIHTDTNNRITRFFLDLLRDYPGLTQAELDKKAMLLMEMLYRDVNLGSLEDSPDLRRQTYRAVTIYLGLALCSESNYRYWLNLGKYHLSEKNLGSERLRIQFRLIEAYIYYIKGLQHYTTLTLDNLMALPELSQPRYESVVKAIRPFRKQLPAFRK